MHEKPITALPPDTVSVQSDQARVSVRAFMIEQLIEKRARQLQVNLCYAREVDPAALPERAPATSINFLSDGSVVVEIFPYT